MSRKCIVQLKCVVSAPLLLITFFTLSRLRYEEQLSEQIALLVQLGVLSGDGDAGYSLQEKTSLLDTRLEHVPHMGLDLTSLEGISAYWDLLESITLSTLEKVCAPYV